MKSPFASSKTEVEEERSGGEKSQFVKRLQMSEKSINFVYKLPIQ
jgi:hypothetical protein